MSEQLIPRLSQTEHWPPAAIGILCFVLTAVAAFIGLRLQQDGVAIFWPAAGVIAALVIVTGGVHRVAVLLGAIGALALGNLYAARELAPALVFMAGNVGEAMILALLFRRRGMRSVHLNSLASVGLFLLYTCIAVFLMSTLTATGLRLTRHSTGDYFDIVFAWFSSHVIGIITVAPALIALIGRPSDTFAALRLNREGWVALITLLLVTYFLVSAMPSANSLALIASLAAIYFLLLWAAARTDTAWSSVALLTLTLIVLVHTAFHRGLFAEDLDGARSFLVVATLWTLTLSVLLEREREAMRAVRRSESQMRDLANAMPQVVFTADASGKVISVNAFGLKYLGVSAEGLRGYRWTERLHPDDVRETTTRYLDAIHKETEYECEYRLRGAHGEYRWQLARAVPLRDENGQIVRWVKTATDIQDRKLAEQARAQSEMALRASENSLRLALEAAKAGTWEYDLRQDRAHWSREMFALYGLDPDQRAPDLKHFAQLIHEDDRDTAIANIESTAARGGPFRLMFRVRRAQGGYIWIESMGSVEIGAQGQPTYARGIDQDVTEREQRIQDLDRYAEELRQADRRKDEFLAMLAHELRNPLAPIRNAIGVVERLPDLQARARDTIQIIRRQVTHLTHLVDDLLDVSRVTQGKITLRREPVNVAGALYAGAELAAPLLESKQQQLKIDAGETAVNVSGDPTRLAQIVGNLLNNAAKFSDPGAPIELSMRPVDNEVEIRVRDRGVGIDPQMLPHVFDLFTQADRSLDRSQGGLGIGLSLVKTLVELHGGRVAAHSEGIGYGSEFTVTLPIDQSSAPARDHAPDVEGGARRTILVVDDNVDSAESLRMLLELAGHEVRCAYDPLQALEVAQAYEPEVVLLDLGLPGMHGFEVARRLQAMPQTRNALLIALTGYGRAEDRELSEEAGFAHHMVKPVDFAALEALLSNSARAHQSQKPTASHLSSANPP